MLQIDTQSYLPWNEAGFAYTSVRDSGNVTATIATASRYPMAVGEAAASNGVYLKGDEKITFALSALAFPPKPRDMIVPPGETTSAVVLETTKYSFLKFWELLVRNLILAYDLRETCTIKRPTVSAGTGGLRSATFTDIATSVPCKLNWDRTAFDQDGTLGRFTGKKQYTLWLGQRTETQAGDIVEVSSVQYEVTEPVGFGIDGLTEIRCTRIA